MPSPVLASKLANESEKRLKKARAEIDWIRDQIKTYVTHADHIDALHFSKGVRDVLKKAIRVRDEIGATTKSLNQVLPSKKRGSGPPTPGRLSVRDQLRGATVQLEKSEKELKLLDKDVQKLIKAQKHKNRSVAKGGGAMTDPTLKALVITVHAILVLVTRVIQSIKKSK